MNRIKEARTAAGLSQKYVAFALGVAGPSVSNWENGKTQPTPENLKALSNLLGVSVDYLLGVDTPTPVALVTDTSGSMQAVPDMRVAVTGPDGMTQTLLHETAHYTGSKPAQATQQEKIAVLERDLYEMLNPHRASRIAEAAEILQSMTDEEYKMALNVLRAMKK